MAQSIKLGSNTYLDWSGVTVDSSGTLLSSKTKNILRILQETVPTAETEYSANWQNYDILIFCAGNYNNTCATITVTNTYFATTSSGGRVQLVPPYGPTYDVYSKNGTSGKIYAKASAETENYYLTVWGVKLGL